MELVGVFGTTFFLAFARTERGLTVMSSSSSSAFRCPRTWAEFTALRDDPATASDAATWWRAQYATPCYVGMSWRVVASLLEHRHAPNVLLFVAAQRNDAGLVAIAFQRGATNLNLGLRGACLHRNERIALSLIARGATHCSSCKWHVATGRLHTNYRQRPRLLRRAECVQ